MSEEQKPYLIVPDVERLPDILMTKRGPAAVQLATLVNVRYVMESLGISARVNMMTNRAVLILKDADLYEDGEDPFEQRIQEYLESVIIDMCLRVGIRQRETVREHIGTIARFDEFHPMEEWLKSLPPPKGDPIADLIDSVETDSQLWPVALEVWLSQCIEAACGWRGKLNYKRSLEYCLVLQGPQGVGKTQFFARLGGDFIKTEADVQLGSSTNAEDSQLRTLRWPIVELAELDGMTRRQDQADMKAFLSRAVDDLRRKYGRDAALMPRKTSFCGTVNVMSFIMDQTGDRRWLPVRVKSINWNAKIDYEAVWSQAYHNWIENGFEKLTAEENALRAQEAKAFVQSMPEGDAIDDHFDKYGEQWDTYIACTKRDICKLLGLDTRLVTSNTVENHMTKLFGEGRKLKGKKNCWWFPAGPISYDAPKADETEAKKYVKWGD